MAIKIWERVSEWKSISGGNVDMGGFDRNAKRGFKETVYGWDDKRGSANKEINI
jgi:hypothetical protein